MEIRKNNLWFRSLVAFSSPRFQHQEFHVYQFHSVHRLERVWTFETTSLEKRKREVNASWS